jgi:hypothetical protein
MMKSLTLALLFAFVALCVQDLPKSNQPAGLQTLNEHLKIFEPLVGKTYRGEFASSTPEKPVFDVSRWERAMNGQAVRILHSVNDGEYGGETILMWDSNRNKVAFWYFTTAGFHTEGTMEIDGKVWTSTEKVTGEANGVTEVKASSEVTPEGGFIMKSEYFRNGAWEKGHEIHYKLAPDAEVRFK